LAFVLLPVVEMLLGVPTDGVLIAWAVVSVVVLAVIWRDLTE
jgi:hypothetical protein